MYNNYFLRGCWFPTKRCCMRPRTTKSPRSSQRCRISHTSWWGTQRTPGSSAHKASTLWGTSSATWGCNSVSFPCTAKEKLNVQLYMCAKYLCKYSKKFFPKSDNWIVDRKKTQARPRYYSLTLITINILLHNRVQESFGILACPPNPQLFKKFHFCFNNN